MAPDPLSAPPGRNLPRLLYLGDVPLTESTGGSNLLFRLLRGYPADRLLVLESNYAGEFGRAGAGRLPQVSHGTFDLAGLRFLRSRLRSAATAGLLLAAPFTARFLGKNVAPFRPEAVLTMGFGFSWRIAFHVARRHGARFHLLVCDDYQSLVPANPAVRWLANWLFRNVYRRADTRLCLTPDIERVFAELYGAHGETLWLPRPAQFEAPQTIAPRVLRDWSDGVVCAYAGTVWEAGPFETLARCLRSVGGRLLLFSTGANAVRLTAEHPNVELRGHVATTEGLIAALRGEADVLFVPMSFSGEGKTNAEISFPSKLIDYTATGVPILIRAPRYASVVRWAEQFPGCAAVVTTEDADALRAAFVELAGDAQKRANLAECALQTGNRLFSHQRVCARFQELLVSGNRTGQTADIP